MKFSKNGGQAMTFLILLLPVLTLSTGIILRSGKTLLLHQSLENHCNKKILDALAEQGKGLQLLGELNPRARLIIDLRRDAETLQKAVPLPSVVAETQTLIMKLRLVQAEIAARQKFITAYALRKSRAILLKKQPLEFGNKITEEFGPTNILALHRSKSALTLHVTEEEDYESEIGAPLQLDQDFDQRQMARGAIVSHTEKFLESWRRLPSLPDVTIQCRAQIQMNSLEDKWSAQTVPSVDKPSLKLSLE